MFHTSYIYKSYFRYKMPERTMTTSFFGLSPLPVGVLSTFLTTSNPSRTFPKTTCRPVNHGVAAVVTKNCDPFVFGPALAMDKIPGPVCLSVKFSSSNLFP